MTIHLPENLENSIRAAVQGGRYASLDEAMADAASLLLQRLKEEQAQQPPATQAEPAPTHQPIWEEFAEIAATVPNEEWAKLPADGAEQHDHYIYGTPKRPPV